MLQAFDHCTGPTPLYLRVAVQLTRNLRSYDPPLALGAATFTTSTTSPTSPTSPTSSASSVHGLIARQLEQLEAVHGAVLVARCFGFLAAAGEGGLAVSELLDLLSTDEEVLKDVFQWWEPPVTASIASTAPPLLHHCATTPNLVRLTVVTRIGAAATAPPADTASVRRGLGADREGL